MNNFVTTIISCEKFLHTRVPVMVKYCVRDFPHYVFTGGSVKVSDQHITLNCKDDYLSLTSKTLAVLQWFLQSSYDYLIKSDDDTFIDYEEIYKLPHVEYCGSFNTFSYLSKNKEYYLDYVYKISSERPDLSDYSSIPHDFKYAEGGCYILSRKSAERIMAFTSANTIPKVILLSEDMTIGYVANLLGIPTTDYKIQSRHYNITKFSLHPCSMGIFPILASKRNFTDRLASLNNLFVFRIHEHNVLTKLQRI